MVQRLCAGQWMDCMIAHNPFDHLQTSVTSYPLPFLPPPPSLSLLSMPLLCFARTQLASERSEKIRGFYIQVWSRQVYSVRS